MRPGRNYWERIFKWDVSGNYFLLTRHFYGFIRRNFQFIRQVCEVIRQSHILLEEEG